MVPNVLLNSSKKAMLATDERERVEHKRVANLVDHVFQLTYTALCDKVVLAEKMNNCNGCVIHRPSQHERSCIMMDKEDAWFYYHFVLTGKVDLSIAVKTRESVCSALGLKLEKSLEMYVTVAESLQTPHSLIQCGLYLSSFPCFISSNSLQSYRPKYNLTYKQSERSGRTILTFWMSSSIYRTIYSI